LDVPKATPVNVDGVTVLYFPVTFPRRLYVSPQLRAALAQRLRRGAPSFDLVHLHSVFLWPTAAAAAAARRAATPYVCTPHGALVADLIRRRGHIRKQLWLRFVERRVLAGAAALHVTSQVEAREAIAMDLRLPPIAIVPFGVDLEAWDASHENELSSEVRSVLQRRPLLLFLGRISWKKGLDRLVAALAAVPEAVLAIAGNDDEGYRMEVERLAVDSNVGSRVVWLGPVHGPEKAALLHLADALVLPSYSENFAVVVLEAMSAGLPVVVTPEVGLAAEVTRHCAGLVTSGEPPQLADTLRRLLSDSAARREMSRNGLLAAREFRWPSVAERMETLYRQTLDREQTEI
jgi:glycosyltransferase involved in cell wall biosynthesis